MNRALLSNEESASSGIWILTKIPADDGLRIVIVSPAGVVIIGIRTRPDRSVVSTHLRSKTDRKGSSRNAVRHLWQTGVGLSLSTLSYINCFQFSDLQ